MELFKYLQPSRIDVLERLMIKFSRPDDFNDPFESLPFVVGLMSPETVESLYEENIETHLDQIKFESVLKYLPKEDLALIPKEYFPLISSITIGQAKEMLNIKDLFKDLILKYPEKIEGSIATAFKKKWNELFGILCLSEKYDNLIMWAHYAQNHEGFVLGFNSEDPFFFQKRSEYDALRTLKKVKYKENRPEITFFNIKMSDSELADYLIENILLTKSNHWEIEDEWRIIFSLKDADEIVDHDNKKSYLFKFPKELITSIYFGVRINDKLRDDMIKIIKDLSSSIKIYQAYLDQRKYFLDFKPLN